MKNLTRYIYPIFLLLLLSTTVLAQRSRPQLTDEQVEQKYPKAKIEKSRILGQKMLQDWKRKRTRAEKIARRHSLPIRKIYKDHTVIELQRFENGHPVYFQTMNLNAAKTISTSLVWEEPYYLDGWGGTAAIWDGGKVRSTHQELTGRVIQQDTSDSLDNHSTHVAGTMIASGYFYDAHGMADQANLDAYDWNADLAEMFLAPQYIQVSNHSYGRNCGWKNLGGLYLWFGDTTISATEDYQFGFYNARSDSVDLLINSSRPYHLVVASAGNDRGDEGPGPNGGHFVVVDTNFVWSTTTRDPDGGIDHYDCIPGGINTAKNVLTVGAVEDIPGGYSTSTDVVMTNFSSWGPTDDGRIKPDVVANGSYLYSCFAGSDFDYDTLRGTSMAAPGVSGSAELLIQQFENYYPTRPAPLASTLKGLIIHTADEAGAFEGPDYRFGWGLMNTKKAVDVINLDYQEGEATHIREYTYEGSPKDITIDYQGTEPLIVTMCWSDPPGTPPSPGLNPTTPMLVHDLDLQVIDSVQTVTMPYVLDPGNPSNPATNGDNDLDNVEKVFMPTGPAGEYIAHISHEGSSFLQDFSIIVTGGKFIEPGPPPPPDTGYYQVIADQVLSDDTTSVGQLSCWNHNTNFWATKEFAPTTWLVSKKWGFQTITAKASNYIHQEEKFNRWHNNSPFIWRRFDVNDDMTIISKLKGLANATVNFFCTSANDTGYQTLDFKDPWFIDNENPAYFYEDMSDPNQYNAKDYRNLGNSAIFEEFDSPIHLDINSIHKGVFLNQPYDDPPNPYYSVRAEAEPVIPFHGQDITWYFQGWDGEDVQFRYPQNTTTAVVFQDSNAVARANYKGHLVSNSSAATAANNIFIVGFDGMVWHYNGSGWRTYPELHNPAWVFRSVAVLGDKIVAVGTDYSQGIQKDIILTGVRY